MPRFEEDVVECYYNLKKYFTVKNIQFNAKSKRPGGKGRGEIDLLAVKIGSNQQIEDAKWIEIGVSAHSHFPFRGEGKHEDIDAVKRFLKKFFQSDAEFEIKKFLNGYRFKYQFISSEFNQKTKDKLENRLKKFGAKLIKISGNNNKILIKVKYVNLENKRKVKVIEIIPFSEILNDISGIFHSEDLMKKNFQNNNLRALQYLVKYQKLT
jgi:hypothetical protein